MYDVAMLSSLELPANSFDVDPRVMSWEGGWLHRDGDELASGN